MRPFGTSEQVARRRARALDLLQQGRKPSEVARRVGATRQSVYRWRRESQKRKSSRRTSRKTPGRPSFLSAAKQRRLAKVLKRGAYANGYAEDYWTLDRIAHVIWELFGIRYRTSSVWYLMQRMGWSSQMPQRRSLARDEQEIAHWKRSVWPQIKKWIDLQAWLFFLDESGFSSVSPRGETPTHYTRLDHHDRLNLIGGLGVTPARCKLRLHLQAHGHSVTGEEVKRFLTHLLQQLPGPIVLVWDRHPIHRRTSVQEFIDNHPRLHVYEFPTSAPELNPAEMVWTQISENAAGTAPHDTAELYDIVYAAIARTRRSRRRLWACIHGSELPWKRSAAEH